MRGAEAEMTTLLLFLLVSLCHFRDAGALVLGCFLGDLAIDSLASLSTICWYTVLLSLLDLGAPTCVPELCTCCAEEGEPMTFLLGMAQYGT